MPRFFVDASDASSGILTVLADDARHIARSLRMAEGDEITLTDGEGTDYICILEKIRDDACECRIKESKASLCEPKSRITLFMAYPKADKLESVIQKSVELGAYAIVPFESSRCIKRPDREKAKERRIRLERIAQEAAKQCGRAVLPKVADLLSFKEMLEEAKKSSLALFCYEGNCASSLKSALPKTAPETISVIVGSEGGFSEEEARAAMEAGLKTVNLGPRILRCETAPSYVLSAISYEYEL